MRTHITTKYSDCKAFEESYPLFMEAFEKDEEAKLLIELGVWGEDFVYAHAFMCENCGHEYYVDWRDRYVSLSYSRYTQKNIPEYRSGYSLSEVEHRYNRCKEKFKKFPCTNREQCSEIRDEFYAFTTSSDKTRCPVCGAAWKCAPHTFATTSHRGRPERLRNDHSQEAHQEVIDKLFEKIHAERVKVHKKMAEEKAVAFETSMSVLDLDVGLDATVSLDSPKALMSYIAKILTLETNLVSLKKWLEVLYQKDLSAAKAVKECVLFAQKDSAEKLREFQCRLKALLTSDPVSDIKKKTVKRKEATYPELPKEPAYEKPGLFNKKKVEAENDRKRQRFELAKLEYSRLLAQCPHQQKVYDDEYEAQVKQAEDEYLRKCNEARANHEAVIAECKEAIAEWEQKTAFFATPAFLENSPEKALRDILEADIAQAEDLFKRTYQARNQLYNCNVIFGKYRNPVALATFYEYLMAGRCTTLEGPTGAYNLYEAEIRANMIISQLSEVINNLEKIRENQFTIYTQLSSMNQALNRLCSTMDTAVNELRGIKDNTAVISENTAVIAHNTAATAYYAKKNAELTDALGYMVAFK